MVSAIPRLIMDDGPISQAPLVEIVPTVGPHIAALKENIRPEDAREVLRLGVSVKHALWWSYRRSMVRKTATIDGVIAAAWGVHGTFMGKTGIPWLITTTEVRKISPLRFARIYQEEVLDMLKLFPRLENYVDSEYTAAIRLLEIIGFHIGNPEPIGNGMFCKFWIESNK